MTQCTGKQEQFCINVASGMLKADSYLEAYPDFNGTRVVASKKANLLMNNPKITARIKELQQPLYDKLALHQDSLLEWVIKVSTGDITSSRDKKRLYKFNPVVLNNVFNKLLPTKTENKNENDNNHTGIEEILKLAKSKAEVTDESK